MGNLGISEIIFTVKFPEAEIGKIEGEGNDFA